MMGLYLRCQNRQIQIMTDQNILECDQYGEVVRHLTPEEVTMVARDPYNYLVCCEQCRRDLKEKDPER
jgi:hypothetical protein